MPIKDYWRVMARRWWLIGMAALVTASVAYGYSKSQTPIYRSSVQLFIMPFRPDYGNVLFSQTIVRQYSQLLKTDRILEAVNQELQLDLSPMALRGKVHTSRRAEDLSIQAQVDDPDPVLAQQIAQSLATQFVADQDLRMKDVDKANRIDVRPYGSAVAATLHRPITRVNVLAGAALGLLIGLVLAFGIEYLDDTLKEAEEVERYLALPVVGLIPATGPRDVAKQRRGVFGQLRGAITSAFLRAD